MGKFFHLQVGPDRLATLVFDTPDKKVNVFDQAVFAELEALIADLSRRNDIGCLVLLSGKAETFIAGADVNLIAAVTDPREAEEGVRGGQRVFAAWESLPFPTVAAIRGTCMGGGTELALASTYRVASDRKEVRIGLPEIRLGILPAWGGCTRLPRLVGIAAALDIILAGKSVASDRAFKMGLVDALLPDASFLALVRDFALAKRDRKRSGGGKAGGLQHFLLEKNPLGRAILFSQARKQTLAQTKGQYPAPIAALETVRTGIEKGREAGFDAEAKAAAGLATGAISKNLIHVFQLMEGVKKAGPKVDGPLPPVREVLVLGAGLMGGGIAHLVADQVGIPVRLKDINAKALESGMAHAAGLFAKQVKRRRLSRSEARRRLTLLRPTLADTGYTGADLMIEAVVENLGVKQKVFAEVAGQTRDEAILASNTSSLSIDKIGELTPGRERVVGMHFFNPVDKMPLIEVIAGEKTGPTAVAVVFDIARKLGKTPVMVKDGPGFLVNRLLMFYSLEAMWLLDEGFAIEHIDQAMNRWGMPLGPMALTDEVGVDVAVKVAHIIGEAFPDRLPLPSWLDKTAGSGRLGAKSGAGFYRYEKGRRTTPDPEVYALLGLKPRFPNPDLEALAERMVLPMVNEAARCLAEGVVGDAGSLDLAMIMGTGFPPFRGGLCRWADEMGLTQVVETLERLAATVGPRFHPAEALRAAAGGGGFYGRFGARAS